MKRLTLAACLLAAGCGAPDAGNDTVANLAPVEAEVPEPPEATAFTSPTAPTPILQVGCRQGECGWEQIQAIEDVETAKGETLRKIVSRTGRSTYSLETLDPPETAKDAEIEWEPGERVSFTLCSLNRPTDATWREDEKTWLVTTFDLADPAGYQVSGSNRYMRLCHALEPGKWSGDDLKRLGYAKAVGDQRRIASEAEMRAFLR